MEIEYKDSDKLVYRKHIAIPELHQSTYYVIDDLVLLKIIQQSCYTGNDVRASWIGPGLPYTHCKKYKRWTLWALNHWAMYSGFLSLVSQNNKSALLDVGCGTGYSTVCLSSICSNFSVVGVDIDEDCIEFANRYNSGGPMLSYAVTDFVTWNVENSRYNYVFALDVLEHIPSVLHYEFVDKCLSMLTEHGLLFITTPNELDVEDSKVGHIGLLNRERVPEFISRYVENIVEGNFYDNEKLVSLDPTEYIIRDSAKTFDVSDGKHRSHFRLIMRS